MFFQKILIAVDDTPHSLVAAEAGFALAHAVKAAIGIVYVLDKSREIVSADLSITPEESRTVLLVEAEKTIGQFIKKYDGAGAVVRFTPEGLPEEEILHIAGDWKAGLIVMGIHGQSGLSRVLTGSTADYVLRHAKIPVLIIPPFFLISL